MRIGGTADGGKMCMRKGKCALFLWFIQQRENDPSIGGRLLQEKARDFHGWFNEGETYFTADIDWIYRWKKMSWCERNQIRNDFFSLTADVTKTGSVSH